MKTMLVQDIPENDHAEFKAVCALDGLLLGDAAKLLMKQYATERLAYFRENDDDDEIILRNADQFPGYAALAKKRAEEA